LYGDLTLIDRDPTKPNEAFFKNVDSIVNRANELGLVMGVVVTYREHVKQGRLKEEVFNQSNAFAFGKMLGKRYQDNAVIWLLGGDEADPTGREEVWSAMARGLKEGSQRTQLVSYHGSGPRANKGFSSSFWFHHEEWLDFNMIQSGHRWGTPNYEFIVHDYHLTPVKPTIDMEARYENHTDRNANRRIDAHQVRQAAYWNMLAGSAGHGYGSNDIYQFYDPLSERPSYKKDYSFPFSTWVGTQHWRQGMDAPGAESLRHLRKLFELRPWYRMVPDQSVIAAGQGEGQDHIQAARAEDGSFLIAYLPLGSPVSIHLGKLSGSKVKAQWYDPRKGTWTLIGQYPKT
ncbi:MAG: glycoside hydrolase family 140 protein, partial [Acidobacteria bacterium]|nr:glycoside hydrolase family 140 protein [Acidobacteriota bacterium]